MTDIKVTSHVDMSILPAYRTMPGGRYLKSRRIKHWRLLFRANIKYVEVY